jgi:anti-sigma B factor antagonist
MITTNDFTVRYEAGTAVIDLVGEINVASEAALNQAYDSAEKNNPSQIVLNFKNVVYMNSTGIALVVGLLARARKTHRKLAVFGLSDHYQEIFRITRLSDFMQLYEDEHSALAGLSETPKWEVR